MSFKNKVEAKYKIISGSRQEEESKLSENLNNKDWIKSALDKMGKDKWVFSGDVNTAEHGGTWAKWDGRGIDIVTTVGYTDAASDYEISFDDISLDADDISKHGGEIITYVDATLEGKQTKPEDQIFSILLGWISYFGGSEDKIEVTPDNYKIKFWEYLKSKGIKK